MNKQLKCLDDTIVEIETEIEKNPDRFLIFTLERLKLYRDYNVERGVEKVVRIHEDKRQVQCGFRGYGIS